MRLLNAHRRPPMNSPPMTSPRIIRLAADDNVVVAVDQIPPGSQVAGVTARERIPRGHKMAATAIAPDEPVRKYGQIIGFAVKPIAPGDWVHEHNIAMRDFARDYRFARGRQERRAAAAGIARHLRGLSAAERQDRHAQLYRRAHLGELLGDRGEVHRRGSQPLRPARRIPRTSTASFPSCTAPAAAWRPRAKAGTCCAAPSGATPRIPISAPR